jgi:hypothetical protein
MNAADESRIRGLLSGDTIHIPQFVVRNGGAMQMEGSR